MLLKLCLLTWNRKKIFQDFVLHPKHGIPVYVVKKQYLLLRTNEVDLDLFIQDIINDNEDKETTLSPDAIKDILDSLDTSWDKKVLKVA